MLQTLLEHGLNRDLQRLRGKKSAKGFVIPKALPGQLEEAD
jgi:hypothetical protein